MLRTFAVDFDFHEPLGGRREFGRLASVIAGRFDSTPQVIDVPIFSYGKVGESQQRRIAEIDESRGAIVYLSNIVLHSAVLIVGDCHVPELQSPLQYDSLASFVNSPHVRGYAVDRHDLLKPAFDDATVLISDLATSRVHNDRLPDDGLFRVLKKTPDCFVCNVLDYDRYFAHCSIDGDEAFFLPPDAGVDFDECIRQRGNDALREYLLGQSIPFATLGDDHMDDEYAVSYGMDCWRCGDERLAFVR